MPKVSISEDAEHGWKVQFDYPDLDSRSFYFGSRRQAQTAVDLGRYVINNQLSLTNVFGYDD